ncbi:MAG: hypothetical protein ACFFDC_06865, partial [Promethearchaeota archaeon]
MWSVTAADWQECTYTIYRNGSNIATGTDQIIVHNIDNLAAGVYNFTIVIMDVFNNKVSHTVIVNVISQSKDTTFLSSSVSLSANTSIISSPTPGWAIVPFILSFIFILVMRRKT